MKKLEMNQMEMVQGGGKWCWDVTVTFFGWQILDHQCDSQGNGSWHWF